MERLKHFLLLFVMLCLFAFRHSYATIDKIALLENSNEPKLVFYSDQKPFYLIKTKDNIINIEIYRNNINTNTIEKFKQNNKSFNLNFKKQNNYLLFQIDGKSYIVKKHIFIVPDKKIKYYRIIIDLKHKKQKTQTIIEEQKQLEIINKLIEEKEKKSEVVITNELNTVVKEITDINEPKIEDIIDREVDFQITKNDKNDLDNFLNELNQLKILTKDFQDDKNSLNKFIENKIVKRINDNLLVVNKMADKLIKKQTYIIVIDAGHGGKDPGAIGVRKSKEKNINLSYAIALKNELEKNKKFKVYLTRNDDVYLELSERIGVARRYKSDLFISLHSDFSSNSKTSGLSIYTLSKKASDTRTAELANSENKTNIIVGMDFYNEYQDTINTLVDLSRKETLNESRKFADLVVQSFELSGLETIYKPHKSANFGVLLAPDFPSVLIELGFLSNNKNEKMLQSYFHKKKVVKSISESIEQHFLNN